MGRIYKSQAQEETIRTTIVKVHTLCCYKPSAIQS
nr:unnamed protein product [Callosobruchus analis]